MAMNRGKKYLYLGVLFVKLQYYLFVMYRFGPEVKILFYRDCEILKYILIS